GPAGMDPKMLLARLEQETEVSIRRALILSLGQFGEDRLPVLERDALLPHLLQFYRDDPDPGMHGATQWLLGQWKACDKLREIDKELASRVVSATRSGWYINRQGQTMIVVPPGNFT